MDRKSKISRRTNETAVELEFNLDGTGKYEVSTGIGFFDHMLCQIAKHGFFDITLKVRGDLEVDCHHTVEDTGIALGSAVAESLRGKEGIKRYGSAVMAMDETLVLCSIDLCGRAYFGFDVSIVPGRLGDMDAEMIEEFFRAVSSQSGMSLHFKLLSGKNSHHIAEGLFKAFALSLDTASQKEPRLAGVPSTKGIL